MPLLSALTKQKLCIDFAALKHACPEGVYVAPIPGQPLRWAGVMFVRKGHYEAAILRFQVHFPPDYPRRPPIVSLLSDVFHPLVTPLTTYAYPARDGGAETLGVPDRDRLPPGGLSLRHGFPEWFATAKDSDENKGPIATHPAHDAAATALATVEVLQYLRVVFDTEAILDSVPLEAAANAGAWHAWRSYRSKTAAAKAPPITTLPNSVGDTGTGRSSSPRQQPGGARRPAEWNWQGVWEDRVKKSIQATLSDHMLYGADSSSVICFSKMDSDTIDEMMSLNRLSVT